VTKHLTDLAQRLADMAKDHPEGVPVEMVETEIRRIGALVEMIEVGLVED